MLGNGVDVSATSPGDSRRRFALGLLSAVAALVFLFGSPILSLVVLAILLAIYVIMTSVTLIRLAWAI